MYDAYTGKLLFKAQHASYEGALPDGSFERRRTISVAPDTPRPPRDVVRIHDEGWIVGTFITDGFFDKAIRFTASSKFITDRFDFLTPGEAALGTTGVRWAFGQARYLKDTVNTPTNANYSPQYEITFGATELVPDEFFLRSRTDLYHIRTTNMALEGFTVATADVIETTSFGDNPFVTVVFSGPDDPMTEMPGPGVATTGVLLYVYKLYEHATEADPYNRPGDKTLLVAQSEVTPHAGGDLRINGEPYRVLTFQAYHDAWNLRVRRA